jgi:hypothetical protein
MLIKMENYIQQIEGTSLIKRSYLIDLASCVNQYLQVFYIYKISSLIVY